MAPIGLLAALTVVSAEEVGCPDDATLLARLHAVGVSVRPSDDVRVRFTREGGKRVARIEVPGASSRRIDHKGPDCSTLADATVALLSVLLDELAERASTPAREPEPEPEPERPEPRRRFHVEGGVVFSRGIVAPFAAGATIGAAFRPARWASFGLVAEHWPERAHPLLQGSVTVSASSLALSACLGRLLAAFTLEACALGHGGVYVLSAERFPVILPTQRPLVGGELDLRGSVAITAAVGIFLRAGVWLPLTRFDVSAGETATGFATTSFGPKGAIGLELRP